MDIRDHIQNTASSIVVFTARCIAAEVIRLLPAYSLSRMGVYWSVAQHWIYMSQYLNMQFLPHKKTRYISTTKNNQEVLLKGRIIVCYENYI
jgi:hypothetical protein